MTELRNTKGTLKNLLLLLHNVGTDQQFNLLMRSAITILCR